MEALLSLAFDNLSSYDGPKIRKGLRQVEGLLAQICLSAPVPSSPAKPHRHHKRSDSKLSSYGDLHDGNQQSGGTEMHNGNGDDDDDKHRSHKTLSELADDPAFREFFKLQEGFEWNVALRLINTLDRLMAKSADGQNDLLILGALDTIQGVLLLHPPSKALFSREQNMNVSMPRVNQKTREKKNI